MGRGTMTIDDGILKHTYHPKPRRKMVKEMHEKDDEEEYLGCFKIWRHEERRPK